MNTDYLRTFLEVATCGSFTAAANNLFLAQSTVSNRIKEIEDEYGIQLFKRGKNFTILTPAGKVLFNHANDILNMEKHLSSELHALGQYVDVLRIATPHILYDSHIANAAIIYTKEFPDISLNIDISHSADILHDIKSKDYDICFTYIPYQHPDYECIPYKLDNLVLATNFNNTEYANGITHKEMLELPLIYTDSLDSDDDWIMPSYKLYPVNLNLDAGIVPFLLDGNWYSLLPKISIKRYLDNSILRSIPLTDIVLPSYKSYIIYKKSGVVSDNIENFITLAHCENI